MEQLIEQKIKYLLQLLQSQTNVNIDDLLNVNIDDLLNVNIDDLLKKTRELLMVQIPEKLQSNTYETIMLIEGYFTIKPDDENEDKNNNKELIFDTTGKNPFEKTVDYIVIDIKNTIFSFDNIYYKNIENPLEFYIKSTKNE